MVDGEEVDDVEEFTYRGAILDKEGGGSKDIMHRLQKVPGTFQRLGRIWAAKVRLFKTLAQLVLLYGCKTCKITRMMNRS